MKKNKAKASDADQVKQFGRRLLALSTGAITPRPQNCMFVCRP
jgi:hypothetical protein